MRQLKEALIGKHNDKNAATYQIIDKATKKDLSTGDVVILNDYSVGYVISGQDFKSADIWLDKYRTGYGSIIFPEYTQKDSFSYIGIGHYTDDLVAPSGMENLNVYLVIKGIASVELRKDAHALWKWFIQDKGFMPYIPKEIVSHL